MTLAVLLFLLAVAYLIEAPLWQPWEPSAVLGSLVDDDWRPWGTLGIIGIGALLVLLMRALARGKRQAWLLTTALLLLSLVGALVEHVVWRSALMLLALLTVALATAPLFSRRSDARASIRGYVALALGGWLTWSQSTLRAMWRVGSAPASTFPAHLTFISLRLTVYALLTYGVWQLVRPALLGRMSARDQRAERVEAGRLVSRHGTASTAHFALSLDKTYFWSPSRQSLIAYRMVGGIALALGDPIGPVEEHEEILAAFTAHCQRQDWRLALYQISPAVQRWCRQRGLFTVKIGEEAVVDVERFALHGKAGAPVRHKVARARCGGLTARAFHQETIPPELFSSLRRISAAWLRRREATSEYGFSMGRFPADWSPDLLTVVALGPQGDAQAFVTWTPLYAGNGWALDNMRRNANAEPGAMELALAESLAWAKARGYGNMCLGMVPLAGLAAPTEAQAPGAGVTPPLARGVERSASHLHRRGILLGNYRSLYFFKNKFHPTWEPRYLAVSEPAALPRALMALAKAMGATWGKLAKDAWTGMRSVS
jgi:phosphatidylglycerol lysyltransferase